MINEIMHSFMCLSKEMNDGFELTAKILKKQKSFNRRVIIFSLLAAGYIVASERRYGDQQAKIKRLSREIEDLKNQKGE